MIKELKLCAENKELKKFIKELEEKKKKRDGLVHRGVNTMEIENMGGLNKPFDGLIGEENFFDDYNDEHFRGVMEEQKSLINLLKSHGRPKYLANVIAIIYVSVFLLFLMISLALRFSQEQEEVILKGLILVTVIILRAL